MFHYTPNKDGRAACGQPIMCPPDGGGCHIEDTDCAACIDAVRRSRPGIVCSTCREPMVGELFVAYHAEAHRNCYPDPVAQILARMRAGTFDRERVTGLRDALTEWLGERIIEVEIRDESSVTRRRTLTLPVPATNPAQMQCPRCGLALSSTVGAPHRCRISSPRW